MKQSWGIIILVLVLGVGGFFSYQKYRQMTIQKQSQLASEQLFRDMIFDPIPAGVSNIWGFDDQLERVQTLLRFTVSADALSDLVALHQYQIVPCLDEDYSVPELYRANIAEWYQPGTASRVVCYQSQGKTASGGFGTLGQYSNRIRSRAESRFLLDQNTQTVYFVETGE